MKLFSSILVFVVATSGLGCIFVRRPHGAGAAQGAPQSTGSEPGGAAASSPEPAAPQAEPKFVPSSLEMHSDCNKTLPIFLGEKPKFGSGTKSSIGSNTTTTFPRHPDGTMTVWIIDDSENGIASAFASTTTKRITISSNCTSLTAE